MTYWLMKSEPESYSIDTLFQAPKKIGCWDGVRNYQARNFMRDSMQIGDQAFFYNSNCKIPGITGIMEVISEAYPDHTQFDPESKYYDPKSNIDKSRWYMRDLKFVQKFKQIVALSELRDNKNLASMLILQKGNRLSITPVTKTQWQTILDMANAKV